MARIISLEAQRLLDNDEVLTTTGRADRRVELRPLGLVGKVGTDSLGVLVEQRHWIGPEGERRLVIGGRKTVLLEGLEK